MFDKLFKKSKMQTILNLFSLERDRILDGPLSELSRLAERREKLILEFLAEGPESPDDIATINELSLKNQSLIESSIAGFKDAEHYIGQQKIPSGITYTAEGQCIIPVVSDTLNDRKV